MADVMNELDFVREINGRSLWEDRGDPVDLVRARDRAVRAALLEELADEEHAAGWSVLLRFNGASVRVAALLFACQAREADYRRRAAAERGEDHA